MAIRRGVVQRSAQIVRNTRSISNTKVNEQQESKKEVQSRTISTASKAAFKMPAVDVEVAIDRTPNPDAQYYQSVDGSFAAAHVAYNLTDTSFIYPITPSSVMGELADVWMAQGKKNVFGQVSDVREMQSEAGAAGALHGALVAGSLCTTFTASQGLLLMIPNMYKIAGELWPCVIHVSARELAGQALSIFGGHADVMACTQTGFAMLSSHTVQEAHDMALVSHIATLKSSVPFLHFFDGFRTSHEVNKIKLLPPSEMLKLVPFDAVRLHWSRALNPTHPTLRGTNQGPDIFFQNVERANPFYVDLADIVQETMDDVAKYIGRKYKLFEYFGAPDAENVVILMGSGSTTIKEAVECLLANGEKVGCVLVHLYRPWSAKHFLEALPKSTKRVAVLDRCKNPAGNGEPMYLDVISTFQQNGKNIFTIGGRYGLGSKDFVPEHGLAVFTHLKKEGHDHFTVGINDDLTHTSIPFAGEPRVDTVPKGTRQCVFWGIGSDGTVGANRSAVKIIGDNTNLMAQAYFSFDAFKSGGVTSSHLRFGPSPITSQYLVTNADYIACHFNEYAKRFRMLHIIKEGGVFVLNSNWTIKDMEKNLPAEFRRLLVERKVKFYNIDARKICTNIGIGKRINMLMQAVFFKLSGVLPIDQASDLLKQSIVHEYGKKGAKVVEMNQKAVDIAFTGGNDILEEVKVPAEWATAVDPPAAAPSGNEFVDKIMKPMMEFRGNDLPVSALSAGGYFPLGTTKYAKRAIAASVPEWNANNCTQCNYCSYVCPHAVIRPFVLTDDELTSAPKTFETRKAKGDFAGLNFRIQIAPKDCTGCEVCVNVCPDDALKMVPLNKALDEEENWEFAVTLPERGQQTDRGTVKGSQFQKPLLEFSGACEGCGETPYVKLLTQLFGERMLIANATGCSSIWGGTASIAPYTVNSKGCGPAWANSLFEDNAEYGFGMAVATAQRRTRVANLAQNVIDNKLGDNNVQKLLGQWIRDRNTGDKASKYMDELVNALKQNSNIPEISQIYEQRDMLVNISQWIIGGDGWANDIGFGGVDHVLASGQNLNVLVLDTEMYSNTGGQASKSSHMGSVSKFALGGKKMQKKALGEMAMSYGNVYVATVSHGNMAHCVKTMLEAESYNGPSLLMCYAPCIEHGMRTGMTKMVQECEAAIDCGYWPLYRFDPRLTAQGKNPFQLDSKRIKGEVLEFLKRQNRFINLDKNNPKEANALRGSFNEFIKLRFNKYKRMNEVDKKVSSAPTGPKVTILYGSETGHSEGLAKELATDFERRDYSVGVQALDDIDPNELPDMGFVVIAISTCGQGAFPKNSLQFWTELQRERPADWLKNLKYCVFGLGDSTYYFFCHTAKLVDARLAALGAQRITPLGIGDDGDEDGFETGFNNWIPNVWQTLGTKTPELKLFEPSISVKVTPDAHPETFHWSGSTEISSKEGAVRITPKDYNRTFVTIEWKSTMPYRIGDSLGIYPRNDASEVKSFLQWFGVDPNTVITIENQGTRQLPEISTIGDLFTKVVDIFGKPNRRFYQALSHFATDASEKERLLAMGDGKGTYVDFLSQTYHYADVLKMFPSAKPSLQYLIEMIPNIKPRYYSISSSPKATPGEIHSLVLIDTWTTPAGKHRTGLTCTMLEKLTASDVVDACIHPSAMEFPEDICPMVCAGIGSGLAPFVSFLRERSWKRKNGIKVGNMALFFGNRYEQKEYLLKDELKQYVDEGLLTLFTAFSRDDPKKKVYVQDIVRTDPALMYEYLVKQKGSMYVCGSREMPKPVQNSLKFCFMTAGGMSEKEADDYLIEMFTTGRYNIESW